MLLVSSSEITGVVFLWLRLAKLSQNAAMKTNLNILSLCTCATLPALNTSGFERYVYVKQLRWPVMLPCCAPNFSACVMKSIIPASSTTVTVQHTGRAKLILTAWILQATTPNQWHAAEQKAWTREQGEILWDNINQKLKIMNLYRR